MTTLVDTSAVYALLDREDDNHDAAVATFAGFRNEQLVTHNYVAVEAAAVVQHRLGPTAIRRLFDDLLPFMEIVYVDESIHGAATATLIASARRKVSLVDLTSFEVMRRWSIDRAFAFDGDFERQGFEVVPR